MDEYSHHVSGFFAQRAQAENTINTLLTKGLPRERIRIFDKDSPPFVSTRVESSNKVLKDVMTDGAVGTAVGSGVGALVEVALVVANVSLFVASPLVAPLMLMGWGAGVGGFIGAAIGIKNKDKGFAELVHDAVNSGQVVLVAETKNEKERLCAQEVIQASVSDYPEIHTD